MFIAPPTEDRDSFSILTKTQIPFHSVLLTETYHIISVIHIFIWVVCVTFDLL